MRIRAKVISVKLPSSEVFIHKPRYEEDHRVQPLHGTQNEMEMSEIEPRVVVLQQFSRFHMIPIRQMFRKMCFCFGSLV